MVHVIVAVLFGFLLVAYTEARANSTLLSQISGKNRPLITHEKICNCAVMILDEHNKMLGFGVSIENGQVLAHKNLIRNPQNCMIRFYYNNQTANLQLIGIYKSVALLKIKSDEKIDMNTIVFARIVIARKGAPTVPKSLTWTGKKLISKIVHFISRNGEYYITKKHVRNKHEKIGDLLFIGATIIGILVEIPNSEGYSKYQNVYNIHDEILQVFEKAPISLSSSGK